MDALIFLNKNFKLFVLVYNKVHLFCCSLVSGLSHVFQGYMQKNQEGLVNLVM